MWEEDVNTFDEETVMDCEIDQGTLLKWEKRKIALRGMITQYNHSPIYPELNKTPDGAIATVGFIYDEDKDDRILTALDNLRDYRIGLVAVAESKGVIEVWSKFPFLKRNIEVECDVWCVINYVPFRNNWVICDEDFIRECIRLAGRGCRPVKLEPVVKEVKPEVPKEKKASEWINDPATDKQLKYILSLGYRGVLPKTKLEAKEIIGKLLTGGF